MNIQGYEEALSEIRGDSEAIEKGKASDNIGGGRT